MTGFKAAAHKAFTIYQCPKLRGYCYNSSIQRYNLDNDSHYFEAGQTAIAANKKG
ncbi:MAG TPA: hypothetical protein V6D25_21430 [Leptolyngbyaceae cyanobacterium]